MVAVVEMALSSAVENGLNRVVVVGVGRLR